MWGGKSPTYPMVNAGGGWSGGGGGHTCPFFPCDLGRGEPGFEEEWKRGMMRGGEGRDWTRQLASERWRLVLMS